MTRELLVDKKGRIELPSEFRSKRQIEAGQRIRLIEKPDGTILLRVGKSLRDLAGIIDGKGIHLTIEQINEAIESKGLEP